MKVIGVRNVDYVREKDGKHVVGQEVVYIFESKRFEGVNADKQWISQTTIAHMEGQRLMVGDEIEFTYGQDYNTKQAYVNGWRYLK